MHARNRYKDKPPDFAYLATKYPDLKLVRSDKSEWKSEQVTDEEFLIQYYSSVI